MKHATLLIINLERVYTMDKVNGLPVVFQHAFIAVHHDKILAAGCGHWQEYADKDTRILDGRGHIAVPGFIEVEAQLTPLDKRDSVRLQLEECMQYMHHGTLTLAHPALYPCLTAQPYIEITNPMSKQLPIVYPYVELGKKKRIYSGRFCISAAGKYPIHDQLSAAQLLGIAERYDSWQLLQALTCWPAQALNRKELGCIHRHAQADILLFAHSNIHALFHTLGAQHLSQVIKKGIRVFPNILIS